MHRRCIHSRRYFRKSLPCRCIARAPQGFLNEQVRVHAFLPLSGCPEPPPGQPPVPCIMTSGRGGREDERDDGKSSSRAIRGRLGRCFGPGAPAGGTRFIMWTEAGPFQTRNPTDAAEVCAIEARRADAEPAGAGTVRGASQPHGDGAAGPETARLSTHRAPGGASGNDEYTRGLRAFRGVLRQLSNH